MTETLTLTPSRVWKQMTPDQRTRAAHAFWSDEEATDDQLQAVLLISQQKKFRPKTVIGTDTAGSIQSGLLFGYAGLVDTVVRRMEQEFGRSCYVIGTGGLSSILAAETTSIQKIEPLLTLEGLELLYRRTKGLPPPAMQV